MRACVCAHTWDVVDETRAKEARPKGGCEDVGKGRRRQALECGPRVEWR